MTLQGDNLSKQLELVAKIPTIPAILRLLREQTGMRFVGFARVTPERWVTCAVLDEGGFGLLPGDELDVNTTLCKAQLEKPATIVFDDFLADATYKDHPAPVLYGFRSHMSAPVLLADGSYFGSLCALDPDPVAINNDRNIAMMESMATLIGRLLDEGFSHEAALQELVNEKDDAISREQFLAVVAHDLRNPLNTMHMASQMLLKAENPSMERIGQRLKSSATRMSELVDDLVDFARGRAGASMPIRLATHTGIAALLEDVVQESRDNFPDRDIRSNISLQGQVICDPARLQLLLSNLISNAITYGSADQPIVVSALQNHAEAQIIVTNWGSPIAPSQIERVFSAYTRDSSTREDTSMGLGLHICQLIAHAHNGQLSVVSTQEGGTRFEFVWPSNGHK